MGRPTKHTDEQITKALHDTAGNITKAAKALGLDRRNLQKRLKKNPDLKPGVFSALPEGHEVYGVSTLVEVKDPLTGESRSQWIKTRQTKQDAAKSDQEVLEAFLEKLPRKPAVKAPAPGVEDLLNLHILTDYHLAMLAWAEEAGEPWDLSIAEDLLVSMFEYGLKKAPKAKVGILGQLGDFTHYDSFESITPTSKHLLDSDTRPQKMVRVGIRVLRRVIDMMLKKYEVVHVLMAEGNHDIMSSAWLREAFAVLYEGEPRVTVDTSASPYYAYEWGQTLLLFHHGHMRKVKDIDHVFVAKFREEFGRTTKAYAHMGHLHHKHEVESGLMDVIQHPTIAAADAYATRHGWVSRRRAPIITYHRQFGDVGSITITPEMLA